MAEVVFTDKELSCIKDMMVSFLESALAGLRTEEPLESLPAERFDADSAEVAVAQSVVKKIGEVA